VIYFLLLLRRLQARKGCITITMIITRKLYVDVDLLMMDGARSVYTVMLFLLLLQLEYFTVIRCISIIIILRLEPFCTWGRTGAPKKVSKIIAYENTTTSWDLAIKTKIRGDSNSFAAVQQFAAQLTCYLLQKYTSYFIIITVQHKTTRQ
jgi:hypothetical protein